MPIAAFERMVATCEETCGRLLAERRGTVVERTELLAVAVGLLEVVAEDLVELDERLPCTASQTAKRSCSSARVAFGSAS